VPAKLIFILPGSGPTDRDGNNPLGVNASPYRLLAEGLVAQGIATLRIDKRGMFASASAVTDANAVTIGDYVEDVRAWLEVLKREAQSESIWLLGHSEGGLVALAAAQELAVRGVILAATPARPFGEIIRQQLSANPENAILQEEGHSIITRLEQGCRAEVKHAHPALQNLFNPAIQDFLIDLFSYHPTERVASVTKPVLILQGLRDLQVEPDEARRLKAANPNAALELLPDTNHVLKQVRSDDRLENLAAYTDASLPLAPGVVAAITQFLAQY
jgi:alpha-beta hydrolase superfamily lysophospholipase